MGATGPMGPGPSQGPQGPIGANGPAGPAGVSAARVAAVPSGPTGPGGFTGATGPVGPIGPMGATGPAWPETTILERDVPCVPGTRLEVRSRLNDRTFTIRRVEGTDQQQNVQNLAVYDGAAFKFFEDGRGFTSVTLEGVDATEAEALCSLCFRRLEFRKAAAAMSHPFWADFVEEVRRTHTVSAVIDS